MASLNPFAPTDPGTLSPDFMPAAVVVDMGEGPDDMGIDEDGVQVSTGEDGSVTVDFAPGSPKWTAAKHKKDDHYANLADFVDESKLDQIAMEVLRWVDSDLESRKPWLDRIANGLQLLGIVKDQANLGPLQMTEAVNHPMLAEAAVQYQARAATEMLPAGGPAKPAVLGDRTDAKMEQSTRVCDYINFLLTLKDKAYYEQTERLFFVQSYEGSQFKKVAYDPLLRMVVSRWVKAEHFVVPYDTASLQTAPRYTHVMTYEHNDILKLQATGFFTDVELGEPTPFKSTDSRIQEVKDRAAGQQESPIEWGMAPHTVFECHCNLELEGFEHTVDGEETGIALPYIVHVERDSNKVLGIYRNWKKDDDWYQKRVWFVHYPFIPGDGFYSYGYLHLAAGLAQGCTAALRILLVGSAFASIAGGFRTKNGRTAGSLTLKPGEYQDTDLDYEELSKAFYTPNFKEPSEALFKVLGLMTEQGQRLFSTQEAMVGDASNTGPVGTTVALIEEGKKVFSAVHKRQHVAQGEELQLIYTLLQEHVDEDGYPYQVHGADRTVMLEDFAPHVDIIPVSDPNIFSTTQRIATAQQLRQMAAETPSLFNARNVAKRMLEAIRLPNPDEVLINQKKMQRLDPVTENTLLIVGQPVHVFPDQNHKAHNAVHQAQASVLQAAANQNPVYQQRIPGFFAHIAEHEAQNFRVEMAKQMGIQLPPIDIYADPGDDVSVDIPAEFDNMISQKAAEIVASMPKPPDPAEAEQKARQAADQLKQQGEQVKQQIAQLEQGKQQLAQQQQALQQQAETVRAAEQKAQDAIRQLDFKKQLDAANAAVADAKTQLAAVKKESDLKDMVAEAVQKVQDMLARDEQARADHRTAVDEKANAVLEEVRNAQHKNEVKDAKKAAAKPSPAKKD